MIIKRLYQDTVLLSRLSLLAEEHNSSNRMQADTMALKSVVKYLLSGLEALEGAL